MNIEELRDYCLAKRGAIECFPFGPDNLVFKVGGKMFLLASLDTQPPSFNAKCDPEEAIALREEYPDSVFPGYHMNKKHWNTVELNGGISDALAMRMIDDSYQLIVDSLPSKLRKEIADLEDQASE